MMEMISVDLNNINENSEEKIWKDKAPFQWF